MNTFPSLILLVTLFLVFSSSAHSDAFVLPSPISLSASSSSSIRATATTTTSPIHHKRGGSAGVSSSLLRIVTTNLRAGSSPIEEHDDDGTDGKVGTTSETPSTIPSDTTTITTTAKNKLSSIVSKFTTLANKNFFLMGMFLVVTMAKLMPSLGVNGSILRPELTVGKYGVGLIFLLSGLSLKGSELTKAVSNIKLNGLIQGSIFVLWPFLIGLPLQSMLNASQLIPPALVDGLLIMTCLPTTVNMCIMLTSASGGNVATSICNAVISNMAGIFVTPALLFHFFGANIKLPFVQMVWKLCKKVLLPVAIGQALRATKIKDVYESNSKGFKRLQEIILLGIVWNAFCNAFTNGLGLDLSHSLVLLTLLPTLHLGSLGALFKVFSLPIFQLSRPEIVAAIFCSSQKTLAFGLPLINTIFEGNPNLASYVAPLMFIHPLQMTLGSLLLPRISKYTAGEQKQ